MQLPDNTLDHAKVGDCTLVLYKWGGLSETSRPKVWENVELFNREGRKLWTVNGMGDCPYWDNDIDMFVGIGNDGANWILNSYSGHSFTVNLETGYASYLSFR